MQSSLLQEMHQERIPTYVDVNSFASMTIDITSKKRLD